MDDPKAASPNDRRGSQRVKKCKQKYSARAHSRTSLNFTDDDMAI
jgi:hypothetical protein